MSADKEGQASRSRRHIAGLTLAAATTGALVALWVYGPPLLRGTLVEDLFPLVYLICAAAVFTLAEMIAHRLLGD